VAVLFVLVALTLRGKHTFSPRIYLLVLIESTVYGLLLGSLVGNLLVRIGIAPTMAIGGGVGASLGWGSAAPLRLGRGQRRAWPLGQLSS